MFEKRRFENVGRHQNFPTDQRSDPHGIAVIVGDSVVGAKMRSTFQSRRRKAAPSGSEAPHRRCSKLGLSPPGWNFEVRLFVSIGFPKWGYPQPSNLVGLSIINHYKPSIVRGTTMIMETLMVPTFLMTGDVVPASTGAEIAPERVFSKPGKRELSSHAMCHAQQKHSMTCPSLRCRSGPNS